MKKYKKILISALACVLLSPVLQAKDSFRAAWSHYTGWEPWQYAADSGILKKWADKYDIEITLTLVNDYIESINIYTSGKFDACTMTNMDALAIPCVGGVDSTALIIGDFSNGNDGIIAKNATSMEDLKGRPINLVELSVSHYLLARALEKSNMRETDIKVVNTSDADIGNLFASSEDPNAAIVTWNPLLMQARNVKGANLIADSSSIPGEIIDLMVVKTKADPRFKKALVGAWYETMTVMSGRSKESKEAIIAMANTAGGTEQEFRAQLRTTKMFYTPEEALAFFNSPELKTTMDHVRTFSFDHALYGDGAASKDLVGIEFADKSFLGDKNFMMLRFDAEFTKLAAEKKL
jgi:NitT/TauT family transport system substrate-binding protein